MKIFLDSGHSIFDVGAVHDSRKENQLTMQLRDAVLPLHHFVVVPDNLTLRQSIDWVNARADINDLAISIHFNANNNRSIRGTEAYYSDRRENILAEIFSRNVANSLGIPNRGAFHDSKTWVGSLGWLRQVKCDAVLFETCYMTNDTDMSVYDPQKAAQGIKNAILEIIPRKIEDLKKQLTLLQELVVALQRLVSLLVKK